MPENVPCLHNAQQLQVKSHTHTQTMKTRSQCKSNRAMVQGIHGQGKGINVQCEGTHDQVRLFMGKCGL